MARRRVAVGGIVTQLLYTDCYSTYRYEMGDFFNWHEDALPLEEVQGNVANGGMRLSMCLSMYVSV